MLFFSSPKANRGAVPGSSGDEIGKALASVSSSTILKMSYIIIFLEHTKRSIND